MIKTIPEIREKLKERTESELRKLLVLVFESMGLHEVTESHGSQEFGKDIVFYDEDKFGKITWTACVVKIKDVNQSSFDTIIRQVNECFRKRYASISKGHVEIDEVFVITNGIYKDNARQQIADLIDGDKRALTFWTDADIARRIEKKEHLLALLFGSHDLVRNLFNEHTGRNLGSDMGIRLLESDFDLQLNSVESFYIKVRAKAKQFEEERGEYLKAIDMQYTNIPAKFLPDIEGILKSRKYLLLHGIATSGKSTTLKNIGRDFIDSHQEGVVFYHELNKIVGELRKTPLMEFLSNDFNSVTNSQLEYSTNIAKTDYILVLLDGLDEIVYDSDRDMILEQISQLKIHLNVKIVLTSRSNDYLDNNKLLKDNFESYELMPLTINDIVTIGSKIINASDQLNGFIKLVKHSELIRSFPKTPLTAILLAILFKEERLNVKELPRSITELYSKFVDVFLNRWDKGKGISEQFLFREKEFVLQKIAEHMHLNGIVSIRENDLIVFLEQLFNKKSMETYASAEDFLTSLQARTSLLIKDEFDGSYKFFHLTIQEYLSIALFEQVDEEVLVNNFFEDWWLNPNIFYAGKKSYSFSVLKRVSEFAKYPIGIDDKFSFVIHCSKVLQAAYLLDNDGRKKVIVSMISVFDHLVKDIVSDIIVIEDNKIRKRTILDIILWVRGLFIEFFGSVQFTSSLKDISKLILNDELEITDITSYCIFYILAVTTKDSDYLYKFLLETKEINPRWYRIVDVDIKIKNLSVSDKKRQSRIRSKAIRNSDYIYKQFSEVLKKHYSSITGLASNI